MLSLRVKARAHSHRQEQVRGKLKSCPPIPLPSLSLKRTFLPKKNSKNPKIELRQSPIRDIRQIRKALRGLSYDDTYSRCRKYFEAMPRHDKHSVDTLTTAVCQYLIGPVFVSSHQTLFVTALCYARPSRSGVTTAKL